MTTNPSGPGPRRWTAGPEHDGMRLDLAITKWSGLSRSRVQRLIRDGLVAVGGEIVPARHRLSAGEQVEVVVPPPVPTAIQPEPIPLDVLYEDEWVMVVNKPAGLVVHPGAGNFTGTLVHALLHRCPDMEGVGGEGRPGLVQRLDKDTSGVMVVAKRDAAYQTLVSAMKRREIRREYWAVVWGTPRETGEIDAPIGRHPRHRTQMAVRDDGRPARTLYRVIRRFDFVSLVALTLQTGRTHQIRVHLAHLGHPVFGDPTYGNRRRRVSGLSGVDRRRARAWHGCIARQALHAAVLEFDHPESGERLRFEAPAPADFAELLRLLES